MHGQNPGVGGGLPAWCTYGARDCAYRRRALTGWLNCDAPPALNLTETLNQSQPPNDSELRH